jgi:hypothetical protein
MPGDEAGGGDAEDGMDVHVGLALWHVGMHVLGPG